MSTSRRRLWAMCVAAGIAVPVAVTTLANASEIGSDDGLSAAFQIDTATTTGTPTVRFSVRNRSANAVSVLASDLPREQQSRPLLKVLRDGVPVPYRGKLVKPLPEAAGEYVQLGAGSSYTVSVDLAGDYDLSQPGNYTVRLASSDVQVGDGSKGSDGSKSGDQVKTATTRRAKLKSKDGTFHAATGFKTAPSSRAASSAAVREGSSASLLGAQVAFRSCTSSQKSQMEQIVSDASDYASSAEAWFSEHPSGGEDYETWFGTFKSSRYNHVKNAFSSIAAELSGETVTLDCSSPDVTNCMAYVYPDDAYTIHLCPGFWRADAQGWDSKAGTLVHESSHFTVNGGSDDHVYGIEEGKRLARSDPDDAVTNADNIEHFAEGL